MLLEGERESVCEKTRDCRELAASSCRAQLPRLKNPSWGRLALTQRGGGEMERGRRECQHNKDKAGPQAHCGFVIVGRGAEPVTTTLLTTCFSDMYT